MQYSPKLKRVMAQIQKIIKDNDVAGVVILHTPGYSEYLNEISPSYSAATIDNNKGEVKIKGKLEHYGGNRSKQLKALSDTCNMFSHFSDVGGSIVLNMIEVSELCNKTFNAENTGGSHTSHNQQNN